jgi:hypothetical protein
MIDDRQAELAIERESRSVASAARARTMGK